MAGRPRKAGPDAMASAEPDVKEPVVVPDGTEEFESVHVDIQETTRESSQKYWMGTLKGCPFQNVALAGMDWPGYTEELPDDPTDPSRYPRPGIVRSLTDTDVARLTEAVGRHVLRPLGSDPSTGRINRAVILDAKKQDAAGNKMYTPEPYDEPLAKWLYMIRVKDRMPPDWRDSPPPTMARVAAKA